MPQHDYVNPEAADLSANLFVENAIKLKKKLWLTIQPLKFILKTFCHTEPLDLNTTLSMSTSSI